MNTQHDITVSGKPHMLLWIDTETTGLDPNQCELLEVGMQVTDLKAETRGDSLHLIVHPDNVRNWANHPEMLKAYEMHLANGLMLACAEAPKTGYDYKHTALNIHEFLNDQLSQYTLHPAGTNVDFDLRQLDVHLSRHLEHPITQGLHHRKLDLTSFRLANGLMLACAEAPKTGYDYKHTALNIHEFLNDQLSQYTLHPAGTNVDFDLRQLDVHLSRHLEHPITQGLHHRKLDLTSFRLADQAIGGNPYQNHAGTHRVQDCIRRDINDYTAYLDIIRTGTQGDRQ